MAARATSKPRETGPRLFFVVERDVHVRRLLSEFLAPLRCSLRFFGDGYAALDAIRRRPPRLVVTDVLVPKLDGLALCRLVKRDQALREVKVVILSAVAAQERARQSEADAFLEKPIERTRIVDLVRTLTGAPAAEESR
jgi:two-component system response regulator MprA